MGFSLGDDRLLYGWRWTDQRGVVRCRQCRLRVRMRSSKSLPRCHPPQHRHDLLRSTVALFGGDIPMLIAV